MVERNEEFFQQFVGIEIPRSILKVKGKKLAAYAEAIGDMNPKYHPKPAAEGEKPDYSEVVAHPAYAAAYTIPGLFKLADIKSKEGEPIIVNVGKLLHTGQDYDFSGCEPITQAAGKIYTFGKVTKIFIKSGLLWIVAVLETQDVDRTKMYCKTTVTVGVRKGGF